MDIDCTIDLYHIPAIAATEREREMEKKKKNLNKTDMKTNCTFTQREISKSIRKKMRNAIPLA